MLNVQYSYWRSSKFWYSPLFVKKQRKFFIKKFQSHMKNLVWMIFFLCSFLIILFKVITLLVCKFSIINLINFWFYSLNLIRFFKKKIWVIFNIRNIFHSKELFQIIWNAVVNLACKLLWLFYRLSIVFFNLLVLYFFYYVISAKSILNSELFSIFGIVFMISLGF